jgi:hypothetical protein
MTYTEEKKHRDYLQVGQNLEDENTLQFVKQYFEGEDASAIHRKAMQLLKQAIQKGEDSRTDPNYDQIAAFEALVSIIEKGDMIDSLDPILVWHIHMAVKGYIIRAQIDEESNEFAPRYLDGTLITSKGEHLETTISLKKYCDKKVSEELEIYKNAIMRQVKENMDKQQAKIDLLEKTIMDMKQSIIKPVSMAEKYPEILIDRQKAF